jgi:hypothetical protein
MVTVGSMGNIDLSHENIKWIKNVTHVGHQDGEYAYLALQETEFVLHFPDQYYNRILDAATTDLIIVYQRMGQDRFLTHLVRPLESEIREFVVAPNFQFGRLVETIGYTGTDHPIPFDSIPRIDLRNSFGYTIELSSRLPINELESFQRAIWSRFEPFFSHTLVDNALNRHLLDNDELARDFASREGKELYRLHRIRERDSRLTAEKKKQASAMGELICSVCSFSFQAVYGESYIECHHTVPVSQGERITRLEDLALVCSNCHRMLHRRIDGAYLSVDELKVRLPELRLPT